MDSKSSPSIPAQQILTNDGRMFLKYRGFYYSKVAKSRCRWRCVCTKTCYVGLTVYPDLTPVREPGKHHHDPTMLCRMSNGRHMFVSDIKRYSRCLGGALIPSGKGKHPLLLYKNYTYTYKVLSGTKFRTKKYRKIMFNGFEYKRVEKEDGSVFYKCVQVQRGCSAFCLLSSDETKLEVKGGVKTNEEWRLGQKLRCLVSSKQSEEESFADVQQLHLQETMGVHFWESYLVLFEEEGRL
ncbi:unnamed protein product [Danaus chrysippus]|uniref:(African queen) hypothetical protein n=1 Tax=Danaus chrysippus TaxID=151541 RepID=A0A8J2WA07_9NEOP|nr:unnamed protein product [Danaus chrysippus]